MGANTGLVPLRNVRVLVVEDTPKHLEAVTISLQALGAQVYMATRLSEALSLYGAVHPDVVVCDLTLRGMSGSALLRQLRANGCTAPAIVLTADHTGRPASPSRLLSAISKLLGG
jgi:two-component system OmpR family response regulator